MIQTDTRRQSQVASGIFLLATVAVLGVILLAALALKPNGTHAVDKHGSDAIQIQTTLNCQGESEVWKFTSWRRPKQYILGCRLPDGRWGLSIGRVSKSLFGGKIIFDELTSFVVKDGSHFSFVEYVSARAVYAGETLLKALD